MVLIPNPPGMTCGCAGGSVKGSAFDDGPIEYGKTMVKNRTQAESSGPEVARRRPWTPSIRNPRSTIRNTT
jgi:hypothetical protein